MFVTDLLVVLLVAMALTAVFSVGIRRHRAWPVILVFFIILFLSTWAVGVWLTPGQLWGVPRLSYVMVGLLFALLLTVLVPFSRYRGSRGSMEEEERTLAIVTFDLYFWILVVGLLTAIIVRYVKF